MAEYLNFNFRQLDPNLSGEANIPIPDSPTTHLAASLKGGAAIVVPGANDRVKLSAVLGWLSGAAPNTLRVAIYRDAPSTQGGTLIFSTLDATDPGGANGTVSLVHVDVPPTTGVVNYFLEISMDAGDGTLVGPVTFIGEVIRP